MIAPRSRSALSAILLALAFTPALAAQVDTNQGEANPGGKGIGFLLNYLNMAGTVRASQFQPLTERERTRLYLKTMANPLGYVKAAFSAGINQWNDKPEEWEQGASGYGKRFGVTQGKLRYDPINRLSNRE
jgi:hypothetical protein